MTAITKQGLKNIVIDEAIVYLNYGEEDERIYGATKGGSTFNVERVFRHMELDGMAEIQVKGAKRLIGENATITCNLAELSAENIRMALAGTEVDDLDVEYDTITSSGEITDEDYVKNVAIVGKLSGHNKPIICQIENVLGDGEFGLDTQEGDEGVVEVQFTAHYDPEEMTRVPWEIRYPKIVI